MNTKTGLATALFAAAVLTTAPTSVWAENMNPELLGGVCTVCHGPGGETQGHIPAINEMSAKAIADRMHEFRDGKRAATIMDKIASGLNDAQIDIVAEYFGAK